MGRSINKHCPLRTSVKGHREEARLLRGLDQSSGMTAAPRCFGSKAGARKTGNAEHSHVARSGSAAEAALIGGIVCTFDVQVDLLTIARTEGVERRSENRKGEVEAMAGACGCTKREATRLCDHS